MIRDEDSGRLLASAHRLLNSRVAQAFGLMFRWPLRDEGWVFVFSRVDRWDLTNLFVFQSIDALWLDADQRVLQVRTIPPFTPWVRGHPGTAYVIELPAGAARKAQTRPGHRVTWTQPQKGI